MYLSYGYTLNIVDSNPFNPIKTVDGIRRYLNSSDFNKVLTGSVNQVTFIGHSVGASNLLNLFFSEKYNAKKQNVFVTPFSKTYTIKSILMIDPIGLPTPLNQNREAQILNNDGTLCRRYVQNPILPIIIGTMNKQPNKNTSIDNNKDGGVFIYNKLINVFGKSYLTLRYLNGDTQVPENTTNPFTYPTTFTYPNFHSDFTNGGPFINLVSGFSNPADYKVDTTGTIGLNLATKMKQMAVTALL